MIAAAILCTLLALAGTCVWRWNEKRNAREIEHNAHTGKGYPS